MSLFLVLKEHQEKLLMYAHNIHNSDPLYAAYMPFEQCNIWQFL